jgi:hypothetical protein
MSSDDLHPNISPGTCCSESSPTKSRPIALVIWTLILSKFWIELAAATGGLRLSKKLTALDQRRFAPPAGTVLVREWDRKAHRVMVMPDGFAWNIPRSSTRQSSGRRSPPPRHQYRTAIPAIGAGNARTLVSSPTRFRPSTDSSKIFQLLAVAAAVSLLHPSARGHQNESPPGLPAYTRYTPMR